MSLTLLLSTAYAYLEFLDEHLIFYLRQFLALTPALLIILIVVFLTLGCLLTSAEDRQEAK